MDKHSGQALGAKLFILIELTRIYLRRSATEQQAIVDKVVTW